MRSAIPLLRVLVLTGLILACGTPPYNPWTVPRRLFRERVSVIAVLPPRTQVPGLNVSVLTAPVESELRLLGYTVVPTAQLSEVVRQLREADIADSIVGGGMPAARRQDRDRLEGLRIDAWVRPTVVVMSADYQGWTAWWHGMMQTIETADGSILPGTWWTRGQVPALSLEVTVENLAGNALYRGYGGIELLKQRKGVVFVAAPLDTRLSDSTRNRKAARIALAELGPHSFRGENSQQIVSAIHPQSQSLPPEQREREWRRGRHGVSTAPDRVREM